MSHVSINRVPKKVYEFKCSVKGLGKIKSTTETFGEMLEYDSSTKKLKYALRQTYFVSQQSYGTNLAA